MNSASTGKDDNNMLFALSDDILLSKIGQYIPSSSLSASPPTDEQYIKRALAWLQVKRSSLCTSIRANERLNDFLKGGVTFERTEVLALIIDIVSPILLPELPRDGLALVAVYIMKRGILEVCDE
jgi:hypothetical protein